MSKLKLKDLGKHELLSNYKIKIKNKWYYIVSGWNKGLWLKEKLEDSKVIPFFFDNFKEIENLEVERR